MYISPLIVILGETQSPKTLLLQKMNSDYTNSNLINYITLGENKEEWFMMSTPDFTSIQDEVFPLLCSLINFTEQFQYRIVQFVFCLKNHDRIKDIAIRIVQEMKKVFYIDSKFITFIIESSNQNILSRDYQTQQEINFVYLNEDKDKQIKFWFENSKKLFFKYAQQRRIQSQDSKYSKQLAERMKNRWIQKIKDQKFIDAGQLLTYIQNQTNLSFLSNELAEIKVDNQIQSLKNFLSTFCEFQPLVNQLQGEFETLLKQNTFLSTCTYCSNCRIFSCQKLQTEFQNFQPFQLISWKYEKTDNIQCQNCFKCFNQFNKHEFLLNSIIYSTVSSSYKSIQLKNIKNQETNGAQFSNEFILESNYIKNKGTYLENNKINEYQNDSQGIRELKLSESSQQNQEAKQLNAIFLSCEIDSKSLIFQKLNNPSDSQNDIRIQDVFKQSKIFCNKFSFIDPPCFQFFKDEEKTINLFKTYFKNHDIHFIFLFADYQRTDLMKSRINSMLKKLLEIRKTRIALVITNSELCDETDTIQEIQDYAKKAKINQTLFIKTNDSSEDIYNSFINCLKDVDDTPISFSATIFAEETEDENELQSQVQIKENLNQMTNKIIEEQKREQQKKSWKSKCNIQQSYKEQMEIEQSLQIGVVQQNSHNSQYIENEKQKLRKKIDEKDRKIGNFSSQIDELQQKLLDLQKMLNLEEEEKYDLTNQLNSFSEQIQIQKKQQEVSENVCRTKNKNKGKH